MKFSLTAGFGVLLALLATNCILTYRAVSMLRHDQERIAQYQGVRVELGGILNDYVNAETGQRGYLLTGNEAYLAPYNAALNQLSESKTRLKSLLAPIDGVEELRARMDAVGDIKLAELAQTLQVRREKGLDAALQVVDTNAGKTSMDQIRALAGQIDTEQKNAMGRLLQVAERRKSVAEAICVTSSLILAAALCWLFVITRQNIAERGRLFDREQAANNALQKALAAERSAHSEAAHANRLKDEFLAVVSHELRTPLNAIVGWTSLLSEGADEADLKEGLDTIEKNARAQARLVDDLLDVSRIITGKLRLQISGIDLGEIVAAVNDGLRPAADARGVTVALHAGDEPMMVSGDMDRLQQIVWNLLSNAIKFTPRGGRVKVSLSREASMVALEVRDTGRGIKPEFLPHIFDRFSQQDASTTRAHEGLGLGLSISRHLAELHGGTLTAASAGPDMGATFRLQIPVMAPQESKPRAGESGSVPAPMEKTDAPPHKSIRNVRILAVDDESDALAVVKRALGREGAEVRTADSVENALSILEDWRPDLIISDIGMPDQDGYTFIRELRNSRDSSLRKVPAIALTAFARESDRFRAIGAGFNDHLAKPIQARTLIEKAAEIAGHP